VDGIRFIERMRANPLDKDALGARDRSAARLFTKSVVARRHSPRHRAQPDDLAIKKPGTGLSPDRLPISSARSWRSRPKISCSR
jgi:hypothetical protein